MEQPVPSTFLPSPAFHPDYAVTWVTCEKRGDVHVFLPDYYDWTVVKDITANFRYIPSIGSVLSC
jgi:hypothetical protein